MSQTVRILEYVRNESPLKVDRDAGVIRGVKLLGWKSANGRRYRPEGVDPALYEGRAVNVNHRARTSDQRSSYDRFGRTVNVSKRADGLYGDLEYLKSHPLAGPVTEAAERMPSLFGLSHDAQGEEARENGEAVIQKVTECHAVDLVAEPATTSGFYESRGYPVKRTLREWIEFSAAKRPGYSRGLKEAAESGILSPDYQMGGPADPEQPAADEEVDHEQAILDAAKAVLDDGALDTAAKLEKIRKLLGIIDDDEEPEEEVEEEEEDEDEEPPVKESKSKKARGKKGGKGKGLTEAQLRRENAKLKAQQLVRKVADEAKVTVPFAILESVRTDLTEARAKEIIDSLRPAGQAPAGGAKSGGGDASAQQRFEESRRQQQGQQPGAPPVPKFEGEKAAEQRLAYLRGQR